MRLFITEKPSVARAIADILGNPQRRSGYTVCGDDVVTHCVGHMFELNEPDAYLPSDIAKTKKGKKVWRRRDLPIIPQTWKYHVKPNTKNQLKVIKGLLGRADVVVNAGDADREGSLIADQVIRYCKSKAPVKRLWLRALDDVSIRRALADMKDSEAYRGWSNAALARSRADWLIGMNLTRLFTLAESKGTLLVVGRVQSPTLALVVERDRLIENFKPIDYFTITATIAHSNGPFDAKWIAPKDFQGLDEAGRLVDKAVAQAITTAIDGSSGQVHRYKTEKKSTPQPLGLSLSDITAIASKRHGYSADDILKGCQSLYETHKLTSYPRSDCSWLPESQHADAQSVLAGIAATHPDIAALVAGADTSIKARIFNDAKVTAHHAIIPTMHKGDHSRLSEREKNLYAIIVRNYLAQFAPKHEFLATTVTVVIGDHRLIATGNVVTVPGWKAIYDDDSSDEKKSSTQTIPPMAVGDHVDCKKASLKAQKTKPPQRYTEGTLIKAMENVHRVVDSPEYRKLLKDGDGIGTSATRANIISDLKRRRYLDTKGRALVSSDLGRYLVDTLPPSVTSPVLTAQYERVLLDIQNNGGSLDDFVREQENFIKQHIHAVEHVNYQCSSCGSDLRQRTNKRNQSKFWGCSAYPKCKTTYEDHNNAPVIQEARA